MEKIYSCESATDVITIDYSPTFYFASTSDRETKHHVQLNAASSRSKLNSWYRNCIAICVEFLSKVRLRLISPTSEILSRLFSFFFFIRNSSMLSRLIRLSWPNTWQIESEQWKSRNCRFRLWCNLFRNKRIVQFFRLEASGILIVCLSLLRATIGIVHVGILSFDRYNSIQ